MTLNAESAGRNEQSPTLKKFAFSGAFNDALRDV